MFPKISLNNVSTLKWTCSQSCCIKCGVLFPIPDRHDTRQIWLSACQHQDHRRPETPGIHVGPPNDLPSQRKDMVYDGTFKVARAPFMQLCSIHAFICSESGDSKKQVPLCYMLMSRRQTSNYVAVFQAVIDALPLNPGVTEAVLDFEKAAWAALRTCRPHIRIHMCWFHWAQAVYRRVCINWSCSTF